MEGLDPLIASIILSFEPSTSFSQTCKSAYEGSQNILVSGILRRYRTVYNLLLYGETADICTVLNNREKISYSPINVVYAAAEKGFPKIFFTFIDEVCLDNESHLELYFLAGKGMSTSIIEFLLRRKCSSYQIVQLLQGAAASQNRFHFLSLVQRFKNYISNHQYVVLHVEVGLTSRAQKKSKTPVEFIIGYSKRGDLQKARKIYQSGFKFSHNIRYQVVCNFAEKGIESHHYFGIKCDSHLYSLYLVYLPEKDFNKYTQYFDTERDFREVYSTLNRLDRATQFLKYVDFTHSDTYYFLGFSGDIITISDLELTFDQASSVAQGAVGKGYIKIVEYLRERFDLDMLLLAKEAIRYNCGKMLHYLIDTSDLLLDIEEILIEGINFGRKTLVNNTMSKYNIELTQNLSFYLHH